MAYAHYGVRTTLVAKSFLSKVSGGAHESMVITIGILNDIGAAGLNSPVHFGRPKLALSTHPFGALAGNGTLIEIVAQRKLKAQATHATLARALRYGKLARVFVGSHALNERGLAKEKAH